MTKGNNIKLFIFSFFCFIMFFLSYWNNFWKMSYPQYFDMSSESLIIGRLLMSEKEGVLSYGGFPGRMLKENKVEETYLQFAYLKFTYLQYDYYLKPDEFKNTDLDEYIAYVTQTGGQGMLFSLLDKLPFQPIVRLSLFRAVNAIFLAFVFTLFIGWSYRNFGFLSSFITFVLMFFSTWLLVFGENLWWVLWAFYMPFLCMLLLLEKKHKNPDSVSNKKIFLYLFFFMFLKCFLNGFEFITTTFIAIFVPIVYYYYLENKTIKQFFVFSVKTGLIAVSAILTESLILIYQLKNLKGTFKAGIDYLLDAYKRRTGDIEINDWSTNFVQNEYLAILTKYIAGNAFSEIKLFHFYFLYLFIIIFIFVGIIIYLSRKWSYNIRKYKALFIATYFSVLCPMSWLIIFKQHAFMHTHLDFIVWYLPFLFFGFLCIGEGVTLLLKLIKEKSFKESSKKISDKT